MSEDWGPEARLTDLDPRELEAWYGGDIADDILYELKRVNMGLDMILEYLRIQEPLVRSIEQEVSR